jgi:TatD DNase family protein
MQDKNKPKYIDIHSHVQFKAFDADRDEVTKRALESGTIMINVGTQIDTSKAAVELTNKYDEGVYAIVGLHPIHTGASYHDEKELGEGGKEFTSRGEILDKEAYRKLLKDPKANKKIVGIGECGLDYYRMDADSVAKQKEAFIAQIELANEFNKPLMLHIRNNQKKELITGHEGKPNAYMDALDLLKQYAKVKGDVHFFAGNVEEAQAFLDFGFTLSFTGVITFTEDYNDVIKITPLDMIMTETDCPYVTPAPYRGARNEPMHVREVVKKIASVKNLTEEEVAKAVMRNAKRVFGL